MAKKPSWAVEKEREKKSLGVEDYWLFGLHSVREALANPARVKLELVVTRNAADRLGDAVPASGLPVRQVEPRDFRVPLDPSSVHQGAAIRVQPLNWGSVSEVCAPHGETPFVLLLDRVSDPHNVGAILRSAEVFGARAVIAPHRHSAPETGALAKAASGALERQPYLRVKNLANAIRTLKDMGYFVTGLDGEAEVDLTPALFSARRSPTALVLGSEGPGLRDLTKQLCDTIARIPSPSGFGSLNVSNAAAVGLYAVSIGG